MCGAFEARGPVWRSLLCSASSPTSLALLAVSLPLLQLLPQGPVRATGAALVPLGLLALWRQGRKASLPSEKGTQPSAKAPSTEADFQPLDDPIRWCFLPSTGALRANTREPVESTNEDASLKFLVLHRPTHEPWRERDRDYPYSWHFSGRKRIWEVRVQVRFKRLPDGPLYFGLEMRHGSGSTKGAMKQFKNVLLRMIRATIGDEFYQTAGDDPAKVQGEAEPPTFAMPLWVVDQFIVSDPAEAPDISSDLAGLGARRTDGLKKYVGAMRDMLETLSCDKVYTFAFWGISQFIDVIKWEFRGLMPGFKMDANKLCGVPPVYVVAYRLAGREEGEEEEDHRHLISKKHYYFKVALWSDARPPEPEFLAGLVRPSDASASAPRRALGAAGPGRERRGRSRHWRERALQTTGRLLVGCCGPQP